MGKLNVDGTDIQVLQIEEDDYISLTDFFICKDDFPYELLMREKAREKRKIHRWQLAGKPVNAGKLEKHTN